MLLFLSPGHSNQVRIFSYRPYILEAQYLALRPNVLSVAGEAAFATVLAIANPRVMMHLRDVVVELPCASEAILQMQR